MKTIKSILILVTMLSLSSASFADVADSMFLTNNLILETSYNFGISDAAILFAVIMFAAGGFRRGKKKPKKTLIVGAFTRAS